MGLLFKPSVCVQKLRSVPSICKAYTPSLIYYKAVYLSNNPFQSSSIYLEETYLKWAYCARNTNHALKIYKLTLITKVPILQLQLSKHFVPVFKERYPEKVSNCDTVLEEKILLGVQ